MAFARVYSGNGSGSARVMSWLRSTRYSARRTSRNWWRMASSRSRSRRSRARCSFRCTATSRASTCRTCCSRCSSMSTSLSPNGTVSLRTGTGTGTRIRTRLNSSLQSPHQRLPSFYCTDLSLTLSFSYAFLSFTYYLSSKHSLSYSFQNVSFCTKHSLVKLRAVSHMSTVQRMTDMKTGSGGSFGYSDLSSTAGYDTFIILFKQRLYSFETHTNLTQTRTHDQ